MHRTWYQQGSVCLWREELGDKCVGVAHRDNADWLVCSIAVI